MIDPGEEQWKIEHAAFGADRRPMVASVFPFLSAMLDNRLRDSAMSLIARSFASAMEPDGDLECFGCCEPWNVERHLAAVLVLEHLPERASDEASTGYMAGLCRACLDDRIIRAACDREFGYEPLQLGAAGHA